MQAEINISAAVKKGNGDTKEDKGKYMMYALYVSYCGWRKRTSRVKATMNGEKNEPVALAIVELGWSEGISQSVS